MTCPEFRAASTGAFAGADDLLPLVRHALVCRACYAWLQSSCEAAAPPEEQVLVADHVFMNLRREE